MDFYRILERSEKKGVIEVYPDFKVVRSKDLMVRSKSAYAIWDEQAGLWSSDEYDVQRLVDEDLERYRATMVVPEDTVVKVKYMRNFSTGTWKQFKNYLAHLSDSAHQLDENLTFLNTEVKKTDYVSKRLPYSIGPGDVNAYDEIMDTLYDPDERAKIEWAIGAVIAGDSKYIQKFVVFYGPPGSGKGTVINIIIDLFDGYYTTFEAKALGQSGNAFATEVFKGNPLVAIQHDGDLSKIEDNARLNSIISHEEMTMNEKFKASYSARISAFLFMGTNKPVKISDAMSGILRRLIDVRPSGRKISARRYQALMTQVKFELGAIANHCLETYRLMGKDYYAGYRAIEMALQTDIFFNYIEAHFDIFKEQNGATLKQAYDLYKIFCDETNVEYRLAQYKFREEFKNYFETFEERAVVDNVRVRSWYGGFKTDKFQMHIKEDETVSSLVMDETESLLDDMLSEYPAQYSKANGSPRLFWSGGVKMVRGEEYIPKQDEVCSTILADIDTSKEHYVKVPENHIVIDFDLKDENGEKSIEKNLEAASKWPATYSEFSKSGSGIHLHYIYDGDVSELSRIYAENIEIKVFNGDAALRRKLSRCNSTPVANLSSGLPVKEKKLMNSGVVKSEKSLRDLIAKNLRKEIHSATKPSMDFIHQILQDAYSSGLVYDVSDLRPKILAFANNSSNQALYCIRLMQNMKFASELGTEDIPADFQDEPKETREVFYDLEVFPNLFVIGWKYAGDSKVVTMINPTAQEVEQLLSMKLIGFNVRRYDNHVLYAASLGYNNEELYQLSQKLINNERAGYFGQAYNISYADIYDYASKKQSLKKWQIELGLRHLELGLPWDEPVDPSLWNKVAEYCGNDVITTEQVHEALRQDFVARQILAELSGLPINATTQNHTARIIFGEVKNPQDEFIYTNLADQFPGYEFDFGKSTYRGEEVGEGGYVYAEPGMYENVAVLDVASMHPTSIEELELFGPYTENFSGLKRARLAIKYKDYDSAKTMLGGILEKYLENPEDAEALSYALKIVINIVYGLTSAKFDNAFRDPRNKDNIVAKRGALFMIDLKHAVQEKGFKVVHIKTDSIKIPDATPEIIEFVMGYGDEWGYTFEHENTYSKFCLVNDAVYIAKTVQGRKPPHWEAVGAQFAHPYVFKTLFSHEPIEFKDLCETKTVQTALYLDMSDIDEPMVFAEKNLRFVGKAGSFCPIQEGKGGGYLMREKDGKFYAATGSKGYRWLEAELVKDAKKEKDIDMTYFTRLVDAAVENMSKHGDVEWFIS